MKQSVMSKSKHVKIQYILCKLARKSSCNSAALRAHKVAADRIRHEREEEDTGTRTCCLFFSRRSRLRKSIGSLERLSSWIMHYTQMMRVIWSNIGNEQNNTSP